MLSEAAGRPEAVLERLADLRQHSRGERRSPHKPLLVLLALGRLVTTGSSALPWAETETLLADLIREFGPVTATSRAQSAAYPFTRLRTDGIWILDADVPMDKIRPLAAGHVTGRLETSVEDALRADPQLAQQAARLLVLSNFPETLAPDVLTAAGLDPDIVLGTAGVADSAGRRRDPQWRSAVLLAWDRQCAFCGYDGQLGAATAGIEAAHVRWFSFDGPDTLDNGLALCSLHHKLLDLGVLGLTGQMCVQVSDAFTARTTAGQMIYELHGRRLQPRRGTILPAADYLSWHALEVFKGQPLVA